MKLFILLSLCFLSFFNNVNHIAGAGRDAAGENPFSPKAYLMRYWSREIHNNLPKPSFLFSKASPLNSVDAVNFARLAAENSLSTHFPSFCSSAKLFCFPDLTNSLEKHDSDSNFIAYDDRNFTNYGTDRLGGVDSFKNYSEVNYVPVNSFTRYSRDSTDHKDKFAHYGTGRNVVDQSFQTYAAGATGGDGQFKNYNSEVNVAYLRFTSYADDANGRPQTFASYSERSNVGGGTFTSYGKNANGSPNEFSSYGKDSNVIASNFNNYGEKGNVNNDSFTSYGFNGNVPENNFKNYGAEANAGSETFSSYRDQSNVGDDTFQSYGKKSNSEKINFGNYGQTFNPGSDRFTGYGEAAKGQAIGFKIYGVNSTFKEYTNKKAMSLKQYTDANSEQAAKKLSGSLVNKWAEPGKFFRESMLKEGTVMPMPDIRDKMPERSFLPRTIVSKLPFSTSKIDGIKQIFHASDNSTMETIIKDSLSECERAPSAGETKRCVASIEDMIDFASSVLGRNMAVRSTDNVEGSKQNIQIGLVKGINGGRVTKSVSCHQSLYPYLLYYCHSVPKVRVYEADLLDPTTNAKINHGVAICHLDTTAWSPTHGAFLALGSSPGRIEVCHWIFENDMTWTIAD
ncbi:polygalacturonase 1 beta-like protein 3 [Tripterygium wilfordii]|uniref:polygalacturonase 1 beta-like protein 3 n=1 Tax=Tripterygium wilfordii TaxID=458696 RepID=UPI0018F86272|nr:polygalacturonase 1 beta-like protein 3 [Tripterygium wilfordii]XP_038702694.1 polygalacturonase 1 beta-like protein 3 [Tripterygium wilfordii]